MAYLYINPDGITRPYSTIGDAQADANNGDTLVLDPGTYAERVDINKVINIRGNTNTPENDDIVINPYPPAYSPCVTLNHAPTSSGSIHIEGVTLYSQDSTGNNQPVFTSVAQGASQYVDLIFNRCRFRKEGGDGKTIMSAGSTYFNKLWFDHCEWVSADAGAVAYINMAWDRAADSRVLACVYVQSSYCHLCSGSPDVHNWVPDPTEGYGPSYSSDWYVPLDYPPVGYFDGYVMEEGSPVQRTINLYKRTNGQFIGTTTSNPSGYYYINTTFSGMHYIVALDAPADPLYNDLIIGSAYPTAL
jgi:hypothetical protein